MNETTHKEFIELAEKIYAEDGLLVKEVRIDWEYRNTTLGDPPYYQLSGITVESRLPG